MSIKPLNDGALITNDGWKRAITCLFFTGGFHLPTGQKKSEDLVLIKEDCDTYDPKQGLSLPYLAMYINNFEIKYKKGQEDAVYHTVRQMHSYLRKLGLVETSEVSPKMHYVTLNSKGVDVALKLQEHDDNKSRFQQQRNISRVSLVVAATALALTAIMVLLAVQRLSLLEERILSHDTIEHRIKNNEKELNRINTENKPQKTQADNPIKITSKNDLVITNEKL
jgi:hypothetical protein